MRPCLLGTEFAPKLVDFRLLAKFLFELSFSEFAPTLADNLLHECITYSPYHFSVLNGVFPS